MWTGMNDDRHAAFVHASNCITLCPDLVHMVEISKIAYGRPWKSQRMSWMMKGEEVGLNISKSSIQIYTRIISGRKRCNVIGQHCSSLRERVQWWIRNREAWKRLNANVYTLKRFIGCQWSLDEFLHTIVEHRMTVTMSLWCVSMERQRFFVLHFWQTKGCIVTLFQSDWIGRFNGYK